MTVPAPAAPGEHIEDVDTPALLVDLDRFEANLDTMAARAATAGVALRPHAKAHRCPMVAHAQLERGAIGQCCQKVAEAEAMVVGGVQNVLITNEIVNPRKLARVAALAQHVEIGVCVDSILGVERLAEAATTFDVEIRVLVEIDAGQHRCGVPPGEAAADLARLITGHRGLKFDGLQAYHGSAQQIRDHSARATAINGTLEAVEATIQAMRAAGISCATVTGAGTGTYPFEAASGLYTEIQPGSYIFMDHSYIRIMGPEGETVVDFAPALFVLTEVMSRPAPDRAIVDAGNKSVSTDGGLPEIADLPGLAVRRVADEHGTIEVEEGDGPALGARLCLLPGHCDTTVGLHDWLVGVRDGCVESVWPITGRGRSY
ncbi:DSD1 family PLP-dependent enzyme [Pelagibius sp.]|uniref:DSD1 family PLP-dependent enzyme n=1 Tax=Pelagibius sp. TaxID=1931238 RepID=UPI003BB05BDB